MLDWVVAFITAVFAVGVLIWLAYNALPVLLVLLM